MSNIVQVQFKNWHDSEYSGPLYTYISDVPVEVGDRVIAPTKYGDFDARVERVNIQLTDISGLKADQLRHITSPATSGKLFDDFFD